MTLGMPLRPGDPESVAGYRVVARLGEGGQGTVFLGQEPDGAGHVAIKLLHTRFDGDATARERFAREIAAAQRVASFCTARILAAEVGGAAPYLVSEFIDGPALSVAVRERGPLAGDDLHRLAVSTATALAAIHRTGIVHRDVKPPNILLGSDGARLVDFGIARAMDATSTLTSRVVGTPSYMSPEQVGGATVGPPTDVFAWASAMVFAATAQAPFGQDTIPAVFNRILTTHPDLGAIPEPLRSAITAALGKDPHDRPAAEVLLHHLVNGTAPATRSLPPEPVTQQERVRWVPKRPDIGRWVWAHFLACWLLAMTALWVVFTLPGAAKGWAVVPGGLFPLWMLWGSQQDRRPLNVRSAEVTVDPRGIVVTTNRHVSAAAWQDIAQVTVTSLGNSWLWGPLTKFSGIYVRPMPGAVPAPRIRAWQRFPVWGSLRIPGWSLWLPMGRSDTQHVAEVREALQHFGGDRWVPFH